jgi:hypothetical protein
VLSRYLASLFFYTLENAIALLERVQAQYRRGEDPELTPKLLAVLYKSVFYTLYRSNDPDAPDKAQKLLDSMDDYVLASQGPAQEATTLVERIKSKGKMLPDGRSDRYFMRKVTGGYGGVGGVDRAIRKSDRSFAGSSKTNDHGPTGYASPKQIQSVS